MIEKYNEFILDRMIKESTLYVSPDILKRLQSIDSEISNDLLNQLGRNIKPDATFLDESDKDGELTFITMRNAVKKLGDIYHGDDEFVKSVENPVGIKVSKSYSIRISDMLKKNEPDFWTQSRNPIKIGRFIRQVFPGKYSDVDIEKFVNEFKSSDEKDLQKFILIEGEDIETYYWHENYKEIKGDLGNSCMARKKNIFNIYVENPDVCKLLVLLEDDKVIGRSLIWKLDRNNGGEIEYFMDRQYTIEQSDVIKFTNYAKENGWAYKTYNNHHSYSNITYLGKEMDCKMVVKVEKKNYDDYPYMDTFKRFDPTTGELFNDTEKDGNDGQYLLEDTDGDYTEISSGKWSEYYDMDIPEDEAVWSNAYGDWLPENRAVHIETGRGRSNTGWFPEDDDNIYYSEWEDEYLHIDDCVYSDDKDEYILKRNSISAAYEIDEDGRIETSWYHQDDDHCIDIDRTMRWYEILSGKNSDWEDVSRMNLKITDRWSTVYKEFYPKIFKVFLYRMKNSKDKIYLSVRDTKILGFEYDKEDKIEIDDFEYHKRLDEAYVNEASLLDTLTTKLENDLIPNTESIADEGEEDMKQMYVDRLKRVWDRMGYDK
jgi:hypothetical protein